MIFAGQRTAIGLRVPPKCEASSFVPLYGVLPAQPQPAWYWLSTFGEPSTSRPPRSSSALMCMCDGGRDAVLGEQLADRAVLALAGGAVVAPDVEDQRVVAVAEPVDLVDEPADLDVDVLGEPGGDLHQAALERPLVLGDVVPGRHASGARGVSCGVGGIQPFSLARVKTRSR